MGHLQFTKLFFCEAITTNFLAMTSNDTISFSYDAFWDRLNSEGSIDVKIKVAGNATVDWWDVAVRILFRQERGLALAFVPIQELIPHLALSLTHSVRSCARIKPLNFVTWDPAQLLNVWLIDGQHEMALEFDEFVIVQVPRPFSSIRWSFQVLFLLITQAFFGKIATR